MRGASRLCNRREKCRQWIQPDGDELSLKYIDSEIDNQQLTQASKTNNRVRGATSHHTNYK